jgi:hypothetical protein
MMRLLSLSAHLCAWLRSWRELGSALRRGLYLLFCATALNVGALNNAHAQQLEPRAYSNAPIGLNFLLASYQYSWGEVLLDPTLPVTNGSATVDSVALTSTPGFGVRWTGPTMLAVVPP